MRFWKTEWDCMGLVKSQWGLPEMGLLQGGSYSFLPFENSHDSSLETQVPQSSLISNPQYHMSLENPCKDRYCLLTLLVKILAKTINDLMTPLFYLQLLIGHRSFRTSKMLLRCNSNWSSNKERC